MNPLRPPDTAPDDPRVGHRFGREAAAGARVVLVGFPTDVGVRRNGGRPGAAAAPAEIRRHLARLTPDARAGEAFVDLLEHAEDLGDVTVSADLEADQERLATTIAGPLASGAFVVVMGGGHETAYGHFLGYVRAGLPVAILNWDAHPDVRDLKDGRGHSGSPFRQALLHPAGLCHGYRVAGLLPHSTAAAHLAFMAQHAATPVWRDELSAAEVARIYQMTEGTTYVTFDMDAVDQAYAPGVSAPAIGGMDVDLWLAAAFEAGRCPAVRSCDVVEMNPNYDRDGQTARLAALTIWHLLRGLAARKPTTPPAATATSRRRGRRS